MGKRSGSVKRCQNIPQLANMLRVYAARVVLFKKPFQSLVADCPYHPDAGMRHVAHVKNNVSRSDVFPFAAGKREASAERWPAPHKAQKPRAQIGGNADAYASTRDWLSLYLGATARRGEQASGAAFAVYHFHSPWRSPTILPFDETDLFVGRNQLLFQPQRADGKYMEHESIGIRSLADARGSVALEAASAEGC